jgi:hypothetical protein
VLDLIRGYALPTYSVLDRLYKEAAQIIADEAIAEQELAFEEENNHMLRMNSVDEESNSSSGEEDEPTYRSSHPPTGPDKPRLPTAVEKPSISSTPWKRRVTGHLSQIQLSSATLPVGVQNLPISFNIAREFLSVNPCHPLSVILEGDESLEVKGMKYWVDQLNNVHQRAAKVHDDIKISLEDKRNFFSFILTTVTVGLAPMAILTGYW